MTELTIELEKLSKKINLPKYKIQTIQEPLLNSKYGNINIVTIECKGSKPLVVIPGYSTKSFITMFEKLIEGYEYINTYSSIYVVCWGSTIKELSQEVIKDLTLTQDIFEKNEEFRIEMANILDKILRSPPLNLQDITLLGKSAGGGVSMYIASNNKNVKELLLCCPATMYHGMVLENRKDILIKLSWNEDDDIIPYETYEYFERDFKINKNKYKMYLYETGGHELNVEFLRDIIS